jgi:hypothetical protein
MIDMLNELDFYANRGRGEWQMDGLGDVVYGLAEDGIGEHRHRQGETPSKPDQGDKHRHHENQSRLDGVSPHL